MSAKFTLVSVLWGVIGFLWFNAYRGYSSDPTNDVRFYYFAAQGILFIFFGGMLAGLLFAIAQPRLFEVEADEFDGENDDDEDGREPEMYDGRRGVRHIPTGRRVSRQRPPSPGRF